MKKELISQKILAFNDELAKKKFDLPANFRILNPFNGEQKESIKKVTTSFYQHYYHDNHTRRMILGSSPARKGSAITGVPFEDASHLHKETGILIENFHINRSSGNFLYEVIEHYGGTKKFYTDFYMNFVCPLGIVRTKEKGKEINCNYYENKRLKTALTPFIIDSIRKQLEFNIDASVCYCIGSGENYAFLAKINEEYHFFDQIIPLEHPRFITQYNADKKDYFMDKYLKALVK